MSSRPGEETMSERVELLPSVLSVRDIYRGRHVFVLATRKLNQKLV